MIRGNQRRSDSQRQLEEVNQSQSESIRGDQKQSPASSRAAPQTCEYSRERKRRLWLSETSKGKQGAAGAVSIGQRKPLKASGDRAGTAEGSSIIKGVTSSSNEFMKGVHQTSSSNEFIEGFHQRRSGLF